MCVGGVGGALVCVGAYVGALVGVGVWLCWFGLWVVAVVWFVRVAWFAHERVPECVGDTGVGRRRSQASGTKAQK